MVTCFNGYASGDKFFKTLAWKTVSMRCLNGSILVFTFETKPELFFFLCLSRSLTEFVVFESKDLVYVNLPIANCTCPV